VGTQDPGFDRNIRTLSYSFQRRRGFAALDFELDLRDPPNQAMRLDSHARNLLEQLNDLIQRLSTSVHHVRV